MVKIRVMERFTLRYSTHVYAARFQHPLYFSNSDEGVMQMLKNSIRKNTVKCFRYKWNSMRITKNISRWVRVINTDVLVS